MMAAVDDKPRVGAAALVSTYPLISLDVSHVINGSCDVATRAAVILASGSRTTGVGQDHVDEGYRAGSTDGPP